MEEIAGTQLILKSKGTEYPGRRRAKDLGHIWLWCQHTAAKWVKGLANSVCLSHSKVMLMTGISTSDSFGNKSG